MNDTYTWERFPSCLLNKIFGCMAMTLLALCYLPGCIVALLQLARGTKYRALPEWMCEWLRMRKQFGLYGLVFGAVHGCLSLAILQPAYQSWWYITTSVTVPGNNTQDVVIQTSSRMNWVGETTILLAALSLVLYVIVGITSLPSVGKTLNWGEFNLVQTYMGLMCLALACGHITVKASHGWVYQSFVDIIQGLGFLSQVIPYVVLAIKLFLWIPCINTRLWNIRRGYIHDGGKETTAPRHAHRATVATVSTVEGGQIHMAGEQVVNGYNGLVIKVEECHVSQAYDDVTEM